MPVPKKFLLSLRIDNKIQPDPVPISSISNFEFTLNNFNVSSTKSSVSGLGIKTFFLL